VVFAGGIVLVAGGLPFVRIFILGRFKGQSHEQIAKPVRAGQCQLEVFILAGAIVVYTALVSSFFETGDPRYRVPTDGLIVLMAFVGVEWCRGSMACARAAMTAAGDRE
jgi:hypothetical protein